jgi:tetratricopeptide (TPR) repeat protein
MLFPLLKPRFLYINSVSLNQNIGIYNPLIQVPVIVTRYLILIFFPLKLSLYHYDFNVNFGEYLILLFIFFSYICFIIYFFKKNKANFFWLSFFIITLLPTLNPFGLASINAERYVYLGSIGIFWVIGNYLSDSINSKRYKFLGIILFFIIITVLTIRTISRNIDWKDEIHLWTSTIKVVPNDHKSYNNLGAIYLDQGRYEEAANLFLSGMKVNPLYPDSYHNLGLLSSKLEKNQKAEEYFINSSKIFQITKQNTLNVALFYNDFV